MPPSMTVAETAAVKPLSPLKKLIYGSGDWGRASFNTLRQIFYAIFLTDVVGLDPRLASFAALISTIWDAVNDPLVGSISDKVRSKMGRRRPFLLIFAVPFSLAFVLLWFAPPWESQLMKMVFVTLAYMISDTIQTLITVPYLALTPELASGYDERTSLTSFRMFLNLLASLVTAVAAPMIIDAALEAGLTTQQGYIIVAAMFGALAAIPYFVIVAVFREKPIPPYEEKQEALNFRQTISLLLQNTPFRYATGIYVLNWIAFDIVALMLPYFLLYWIAGGDMLFQVNVFGMKVSLDSVVLGILLLVATVSIPLWNWLAQKFNKRAAYISGMVFWIVVQTIIITIQPGQISLIMVLAALAGISVSTAHVMPEAIFPDVIDWDELRTRTRREGMYYGAINFLRKLSTAAAIFVALQILGWFGYQSPPEGVIHFEQLPLTISAIRIITGPVVVVLLLSAIGIAWGYPLSRERQTRIQRALARRQERERRKERREERRLLRKMMRAQRKANRQARRMERKMRSSLKKDRM